MSTPDTPLPKLPASQAFSLTASVYTADDMREYARAALAPQAEKHAKEMCVHDAFYKLTVSQRDRAWREGDALRAENEALRADAQRYLYLRNRAPESVLNVTGRLAGCWIDCDSDLGDRLILLTGGDADAAIDAARGSAG